MLCLMLATFLVPQAQPPSAPFAAGHEVLLSLANNTRTDQRLEFLGLDGRVFHGPLLPVLLEKKPTGVSYDPISDRILAVTSGNAVGFYLNTINPHDHTVQVVTSPSLFGPGVIACHPVTGELYYLNYINSYLYTIDRQTAVATLIGPSHWPGTFVGMAFHPQTLDLLAVSAPNGGGPNTLLRINLHNGHALPLAMVGTVTGIAFDADGKLYGLRHIPGTEKIADIVAIDPVSGSQALLGTFSSGPWLDDLAFLPASPAPLIAAPNPPFAGQAITVRISGMKADASTWLVWSHNGLGTTALPQLGVVLGLAAPLSHGPPLLSALDGRLVVPGLLPPTPGQSYTVQAVQAGAISEVLSFTAQ